MIIQGLQKLTLLDFPGCVAATVFLHGCNLRCPFCHNAGLVVRSAENAISFEEFESFLKKRKGILDGICITGGEPLINPDIHKIFSAAKSYGYKTKLDTNGFFPEKLKELVGSGLVDYVAMDIKSSPKNYPLACGVETDVSRPMESVEFLMGNGVEYEFRTTCVAGLHTKEDFEDIGKWIKGAKRYFLQQYVDSGDVISPLFRSPTGEEMQAFLDAARPFVPNAAVRGL